jgi:hypothetical protein
MSDGSTRRKTISSPKREPERDIVVPAPVLERLRAEREAKRSRALTILDNLEEAR